MSQDIPRDDADIDGFFSTARTAGREAAVELPAGGYREYLFDHDDPHIARFRGMTYEEFATDRYLSADFLRDLLSGWDELLAEPFVGVTSDGVVREGLYSLPPAPATDDAEAVAAAEKMLALLGPEEREKFTYAVGDNEFRAWSNPEFVFHRVGLRLEDLDAAVSESFLALVRASLSVQGYERVREAMALNGFLGELVDLPKIMNDRSYWAALYGTPEVGGAWGWQLFGHHVAVNFVSVGGRHVAAPVFIGAEPAVSDGVRPPIFEARERLAIELASSLTPEQRAKAVVYQSVLDPAMPEGRLHPADERHVAGAFRDNRVVPYEGIPAGELDDGQRKLLRAMAEDFLLLQDAQRALTMAEFDAHLDETWFSWYGATDGTQPTYLRIQSPVFLAELDHHAGVWLTNRLPARFHVHSTFRLPNGNDYGRAYLAEWASKSD
ncbi:DUF3500 domain-containing protein [Nocardia macrotermitis]|uniref:DUF3500 domain-containing protein n=1 Tax=Nocardia macrotermitis TaxID=2585198 RepID=A0A7K0D9Z0_9NOCA|nr:DUF3500 domain-containing protein [Nocardia macrotermitis]MQY22583.1 hypothetical protein [Nocardia macrotermitis]